MDNREFDWLNPFPQPTHTAATTPPLDLMWEDFSLPQNFVIDLDAVGSGRLSGIPGNPSPRSLAPRPGSARRQGQGRAKSEPGLYAKLLIEYSYDLTNERAEQLALEWAAAGFEPADFRLWSKAGAYVDDAPICAELVAAGVTAIMAGKRMNGLGGDRRTIFELVKSKVWTVSMAASSCERSAARPAR